MNKSIWAHCPDYHKYAKWSKERKKYLWAQLTPAEKGGKKRTVIG